MKNKRMKQWLSVLMAAVLTLGSPAITADSAQAAETTAEILQDSTDREINFNKDWKFLFDETEQLDAGGKDYNDSSWENVQIPHDFSITQEFSNDYEAESGFLPGGTGWYRKNVVFPASYGGKSVILNFDGVYNNAYVYINGTKIGEHHYGYTNFSFDISDLITCDGTSENVIAVKAVSEFPSSRWYSGAGIYRDVTLTVADPVHVGLNGTYVTTPQLEAQKDGDVTVKVETTVQNDSNTQINAAVRTTILDAKGTTVSKSPAENTLSIAAENSEKQTQEITVNKPKLWDCDNPNLYDVKTEILVGGKVVDTYTTEFGFRYFAYDANTGFSLNGTKMKMKGVCMHHDQGALGAAAYRDAVYRQVEILKEMGCNAIRASHNAPSKILLEACNELGMLMMDEVYDGWAYAKNGNSNDFSKYFNQTLGENNHLIGGSSDEKWYQFALESFVNRDKNDPSVVMWSIGNEINFGVPGTTNPTYVTEYEGYASNMIQWIQDIDPTKPITHGDNNVAGNASDLRTHVDELLAASGGVVGLNYSPGVYGSLHQRKPDWCLVGSETVSAINSRGIYSTKSQFSQTGNYQNTAYDTHAVDWGQTARNAWLPVIKNDFMSGTFVWTGFDYIGEPTNWNGLNTGSVSGDAKAIPNSSYFGIIDTAGFPKDSFYFYTSQWRDDKTTMHIVPGCWNEDDLVVSGGKVPVDLYSNAAKVELYLNGELIGSATRESITTDAGYAYGMYRTTSENPSKCTAGNTADNNTAGNMAAQFQVKYEAGTLSAKAYDENNNEITDTLGIKQVKTNSDEGSKLVVTPEKTEIAADGSSLAYITVDITDRNGEFASQADNNIRFTLTGHGEIAGVDNGNASTVDKFQQKSVLTNSKNANINAFSGKALVIIKSTETAGGFTLKVESDGMDAKTVQVNTVNSAEAQPYIKSYDLKTEYQFDMGTKPSLQTKAAAVTSDNKNASLIVKWDEITEEIYNNPGEYQINGNMIYGMEQIPVTATLQVKPVIAAIKHYSKATRPNIVPALPETVAAILPDGRLYGDYPVTWDSVSDTAFANIGDLVTINGTVTISENKTMPTKLTVRVAESITTTPKNIAPDCSSLTQTCYPESDNLRAIINGETDLAASRKDKQKRWTNWDSALLTGPAITFTWEDVQTLKSVNLYHYTDDSIHTLPTEVSFSYSDGITTKTLDANEVTATQVDTNNNNKATYTFQSELNALSLTIKLANNNQHPPYVGLVECEIINTGVSHQTNGTAVLSNFTINGTAVPGFTANNFNPDGYTMNIEGLSQEASVAAEATNNASVSIVPADAGGTIKVLVQSEDGKTTNIYSVKLNSRSDLNQNVAAAISEAEQKEQNDYTPDSWDSFQKALTKLQNIQTSGTTDEIQAALDEVNTAMNQLVTKEKELEQNVYNATLEASQKRPDTYSQNSWNAFQSALSKLQNAMASDSYGEIQNALHELNTAMDQLISKEEELDQNVNTAISEAAKKVQSAYTPASWNVFQAALTKLKNLQAAGSFAEIQTALNELKTAMANLKAAAKEEPKLPKPGTTYPDDSKKANYKVITSAASGGTVTFVKPANNKNRTFTVPDTVKIQNVTFKVTNIEKKAFKNNKKLKTVTIGKNISEIGASAFEGAKVLKTVKVKSTVLKKVGKKAFKGISPKAKIKVPKSKLKAYKKLFKNKGQKSSVKITK